MLEKCRSILTLMCLCYSILYLWFSRHKRALKITGYVIRVTTSNHRDIVIKDTLIVNTWHSLEFLGKRNLQEEVCTFGWPLYISEQIVNCCGKPGHRTWHYSLDRSSFIVHEKLNILLRSTGVQVMKYNCLYYSISNGDFLYWKW
jgi:hypothetical protein